MQTPDCLELKQDYVSAFPYKLYRSKYLVLYYPFVNGLIWVNFALIWNELIMYFGSIKQPNLYANWMMKVFAVSVEFSCNT